jgi:NADPH:quinone reductase-like Zn-dependent oxidoreductase
MAGLTALTTITDLKVDESDTIVISAAVGGVGHIECQLAAIAGATVIGIAGEENFDYLRSIGAKPVAYGPDIKDRILKAAGGRKITKLIDNYGDYEALAAELQVEQCKSSDDRRDLEVTYYLDNGKNSETLIHLRDVVELVENWHLRVLISGFYPFEYVVNAMDELDHRHSRGKVVLGMNTVAEPETYLLGKLRAYFEKTSAKVSNGRSLVPSMNSQSDN